MRTLCTMHSLRTQNISQNMWVTFVVFHLEKQAFALITYSLLTCWYLSFSLVSLIQVKSEQCSFFLVSEEQGREVNRQSVDRGLYFQSTIVHLLYNFIPINSVSLTIVVTNEKKFLWSRSKLWYNKIPSFKMKICNKSSCVKLHSRV